MSLGPKFSDEKVASTVVEAVRTMRALSPPSPAPQHELQGPRVVVSVSPSGMLSANHCPVLIVTYT